MAEKDLADLRLRPFLSRARIDCDLFAYKCPLSWGSLTRTARRDVRHCGECDREVHLVTNEEQLISCAREGLCVAVIRPEELPDPKTLDWDRSYAEDDDDDDYRRGFTMGVVL